MNSSVSEERRRVLAGLADALIAEGSGKPSASAAGVPGELLDRCLEAVPSLRSPLMAILDEAEGRDPDEFARELYARRPEDFTVLSTSVMGAYYLSPEVRKLIGYPGQAANPLSLAAAPEYLENGMLERVYERHPGYREPQGRERQPSPT